MATGNILVSYDGGDANKHTIDAKLFGQSLQGLDRMVSDSILIFATQRLPKKGERAPLILKVREPKAGSYALPGVYEEASSLLAMGMPIINAIGPEVISYYVGAVLDRFKGEDQAVERAIEAMVQMNQEAHKTIREIEDHRHLEMMGMQDILRTSINSSGKAAVDFVAPIGRSVDSATFSSGGSGKAMVDVEGAEAIRDSQKLEWSRVRTEILRTDGFKFHSNALSVENPEGDGFIMAEVIDPVFEEESNPYTSAAQRRAKIEVLARKGYKNNALAKIQVLDFISEV